MSTIDRPRVRGWVVRYLPLEVLGTLAALGAAWIAYQASGSLAVAAIAGALGESVGYYALVVVRAARGHRASARVRRLPGRGRRAWAVTWLTARSVAAEFGPAELVDSFLVRPALLWAASALWGAQPRRLARRQARRRRRVLPRRDRLLRDGRRLILPDGGRSPEASVTEASVTGHPPTPSSPNPSPEGALR